TRYFYASIEVDVLGMVLRHAVGKSVSRIRARQDMGTHRCRSGRLLADRCTGLRSCAWILQRCVARLCMARTPPCPRWDVGWKADHSRAMDDRCDHRARLRRVSRTRKGARSHVRVWLSPVAACVRQTPVRTLRRLRSAHLCRSSIQAYNGPHIGRRKTEIWRLWSALVKQFGRP